MATDFDKHLKIKCPNQYTKYQVNKNYSSVVTGKERKNEPWLDIKNSYFNKLQGTNVKVQGKWTTSWQSFHYKCSKWKLYLNITYMVYSSRVAYSDENSVTPSTKQILV